MFDAYIHTNMFDAEQTWWLSRAAMYGIMGLFQQWEGFALIAGVEKMRQFSKFNTSVVRPQGSDPMLQITLSVEDAQFLRDVLVVADDEEYDTTALIAAVQDVLDNIA
jgi:hypothetical protein